MHLTPALFGATAVSAIGVVILWANPGRLINRAVFVCALHVAGWLGLLHVAVSIPDGVFWLRCSSSFGSLLPFDLWCVQEVIASGSSAWVKRRWKTGVVWLLVTFALAVLPFTEFFIPLHSTSTAKVFGRGYYLYIFGVIALYAALCYSTVRHIRTVVGSRKLELQVWLLGGSSAAVLVICLMAANAILHDPALIRLQPFVVLVFFGGTMASITLHRVFDARQILLVALEKSTFVALVGIFAYSIYRGLELVATDAIALLGATALSIWFASVVTKGLDRVFRFYPQAGSVRQAAFAVAQRETRTGTLEENFRSILRGWGQSEEALITSKPRDPVGRHEDAMEENSLVIRALRQLRWATPERLARERPTVAREALKVFLNQHQLGVLVLEEGPALTVMVGVGVPASRRPYTYPQVTQLIELASIMESALERAHFSAKAQHAEQLATVGLLGASLAHEIRNPLVTIKSFVQLLPKHHSDAAFREKFFRLIGDEVTRIDQLTEQLLEMASPRSYAAQIIELHPVLRASLDLVATKAAHRNVQLLTEFSAEPDHVFTDASAAKQVMLNLCFNALQAVETRDDEQRWVKIATRNLGQGVEMAVADNGPGIAPEIRSRLFQPFQTTKSTGFGLGLAICSDILTNLNASLTVDPPAPGQGATFRVVFPCQPSSS